MEESAILTMFLDSARPFGRSPFGFASLRGGCARIFAGLFLTGRLVDHLDAHAGGDGLGGLADDYLVIYANAVQHLDGLLGHDAQLYGYGDRASPRTMYTRERPPSERIAARGTSSTSRFASGRISTRAKTPAFGSVIPTCATSPASKTAWPTSARSRG